MNYRKVEKNQVEGFHTIEELVKIFKLADDRQIIAAFGENLVIVEDALVLESKYLVDRFGFDPKEPFMTRREVMAELDITFLQFDRLIKKGLLPKFKLVQAQGSTILLLRRDVENLKKTIIEYSSADRLIDQSNKFRHVLEIILDYDLKYVRAISENERVLDILKMYLIDNRSREEIAEQLGVGGEAVRISIMKGIRAFDGFFKKLESHFTEVEKMQIEIRKLQTEKSELITKNQYLSEFLRTKTNYGEVGLENLLADEPIALINLLNSVDVIEDMDISVRFRSVLKGAIRVLKARYKMPGYEFRLLWLLETPIDDFFQFKNCGKITVNELIDLVASIGFYPNEERQRLVLTPENIMSRVRDKALAWDFYNRTKTTPVKLV